VQIRLLDLAATEPGCTSVLLSLASGDLAGLGEIHLPDNEMKGAALSLLKASSSLLENVDLRNLNVALDAVSSLTDRDSSAGTPVRAALDMALHDLNGKLRGCPVHAMLGGSFRTEVTLSLHFRNGSTVPRAEATAGSVLLEYRSEPSRQAATYWNSSANGWLAAAIEILGAAVQVDIDAGGTFDNPALARTFVESLLSKGPRLNLGLLQPLSDVDLVGHAVLCATLPIAIILDSSVRSAQIMGQIVRLAAADRVVVNVERVGGLRAAMQIVSIAEAASMGVSSASFCCSAVGAAAALHVAAALHDTFPARLDNLLTAGGPIADAGFAVTAGVARLGDAPGLGVLLRDEATAAFQHLF
jgi:L-alanine-DL-glutamate epimerase-like enolase superfamily enzyme